MNDFETNELWVVVSSDRFCNLMFLYTYLAHIYDN